MAIKVGRNINLDWENREDEGPPVKDVDVNPDLVKLFKFIWDELSKEKEVENERRKQNG